MVDEPSALETAVQNHLDGRLDEAEVVYDEILRNEPDHADILHLKGIMSFQRQDLDGAVDFFERAIAADPAIGKYHGNLATVQIALQRFDDALATYEKAVQIDPDDAALKNGLGAIQREFGRTDEAMASFRAAVAIDPDLGQAHGNLATLLLQLNRPDEAMESALAGVAADDEDPDLHNIQAAVHGLKGENDAAIKCAGDALALDPHHVEALRNMGVLLRREGRDDEAAGFEEQLAALEAEIQ